MWITSTEYRKKYNITPQHLYALKKSGKLKTKPYVGKEILIYDDIDDSPERYDCIYARISPSENVEKLNEQVSYIKKYMISNGVKPAKIYTDIVSGFEINRIGLNELIYDVISNKINSIYISVEDRLSIDNYDYFLNLFEKFGVKIEKIFLEDKNDINNTNYVDFVEKIHKISNDFSNISTQSSKNLSEILNLL